MSISANAKLRRLWLNIHLCIGLGLGVLLAPIGLSGSLLVFKDQLDAALNPVRYAVTSGEALAPSALLISAAGALGRETQPMVVRFPDAAGWPVTVTARQNTRQATRQGQGGRPRLTTVYLDPPTGRVLDAADLRSTLVNFLHRFHENLTVPEYEGRSIVGWVGVAMLTMSLSGIYLWWPRNLGFLGGFRRGLRWRRGPKVSFNLHHTAGFWIAIPLAVVSATGIYLGFPQQGRQWLATVAPMTPQQRGGFNVPLLRETHLTADAALTAALAAAPGARPAAIFLPTQQNHAWRVQLRATDAGELATVMVDDRNGVASPAVQLAGDRAALSIRALHEGSALGPLWRLIVFACGLLPSLFLVTGVMIWLRSRDTQTGAAPVAGMPRLDAAE